MVTRDGREVPIPSVYFGIYSCTIAQGGMYILDSHFSFRIGGNNLNREEWADVRECSPQIVPRQDTGVTLAAVEELVRDTHRLVRDVRRRQEYNFDVR